MTDDNDIEEREDAEETPAPPPRSTVGRPSKKRVGAGGRDPSDKRVWREDKAHRRWAEICEILTAGTAEERIQIHCPPEGADPGDIEVDVQRVEPPGGGVMPRIPGSAIWGEGKSPANEFYRVLVEHYHSRYRPSVGTPGGGAAKYRCTFYWAGPNKYLSYSTIELAPFDEIIDQLRGMQGERLPSGGGYARRPLPREAPVGAGGYSGGFGGGYGGDDAWRRAYEAERARVDQLQAELREEWKRMHPGAPLPPSLENVAAGAGASPPASAPAAATPPPSPIGFDVNQFAQAITSSFAGLLQEAGVLRAPVNAPTSAGPAGAAGTRAGAPGAPQSFGGGGGISGAFREAAAESPRIARLRREIEETREELTLRAELADLREEFGGGDEPVDPAAGAGSTAIEPKKDEEKPPFEYIEIPGPKPYGEPMYRLKQNAPADGVVEMVQRWSGVAPGLTKAVGGGLGRFLEGAGGAVVTQVGASVARAIDRVSAGVAKGATAGAAGAAGRQSAEVEAEVVSVTPPGAVDASSPPSRENGAHGNGTHSETPGAGGWPRI